MIWHMSAGLTGKKDCMNSREHWDNIYQTKDAKQVSWYAPHLAQSLNLILSTNISKQEPIIDVGAGASRLADDLLKEGFSDITLLDIASESLETSKKRLGAAAQKIKWMVGDITKAKLPKNHYTLWHDRAVFHFLMQAEDRRAYVRQLNASLKLGGHVIVSTFSLKGPERCSGLEIVRYSPEILATELGENFKLIKAVDENHQTPFNTTQAFLYCHFIKQ